MLANDIDLGYRCFRVLGVTGNHLMGVNPLNLNPEVW